MIKRSDLLHLYLAHLKFEINGIYSVALQTAISLKFTVVKQITTFHDALRDVRRLSFMVL